MAKKIVNGIILIAVITLVIISVLDPYTEIFKLKPFPNSYENRIKYIEDRGYNIKSSSGFSHEYILTKLMLTTNSIREWSVQSVDPMEFIGESISFYRFVVTNHKLDKDGDQNETLLVLMVCNDEIFGGYSVVSNSEPLFGWVYNIDGYSLEDVTGKMYTSWVKDWMEKYK